MRPKNLIEATNYFLDVMLDESSSSDFRSRIKEINTTHPSSWSGITATNESDDLPMDFVSGWFIHFTNADVDALVRDGIRGVRYMNDLMMATPTDENHIDIGVDVFFAYNIEMLDADHFSNAKQTYGRNAVIFKTNNALEIFSPIDYDFECLVPVNDVHEAIPINNITRSQFEEIRGKLK